MENDDGENKKVDEVENNKKYNEQGLNQTLNSIKEIDIRLFY
jgi:hypothetical protein